MNINIFLYIVLALAVFALIRELICWYFKINDRLSAIKQVIENQLLMIKAINNMNDIKPPTHYNCRSSLDKRTLSTPNKEEN